MSIAARVIVGGAVMCLGYVIGKAAAQSEINDITKSGDINITVIEQKEREEDEQ